MLPSGTHDGQAPPLPGRAGLTSIRCCVSSSQDLKLPTAHTTVAFKGAQSQGAPRFVWGELLAGHTVGLETLRANLSNEELLDFCQGS